MAVRLDASEPWVRWDWVGSHTGRILDALTQHVELTAIAVGAGLVIAAPVGVLAWRYRASRGPILATSGVLYTIPSLALFAMLVPWTGLSVVTSEIGLVSYTLLILIRNIVVGLDGVPAEVRDAAQGMGRIATVTTIGLVTVTALIGQGGLGQLMLDGLYRDFRTPLVVGAVLSVTLAVVGDVLLAVLQRVLTPWRRG